MTHHIDSYTCWLALFSFIALVYVVYIPISVYYTRKFWRHSLAMEICKRTPQNVLLFIICALIFLGADRPLHLLYFTCLNLNYKTCETYSNISLKLTYPISTLGIFFSLSMRIWLLYYNIKFNQSTQNSKWKQLINPSEINSTTNNFFIKYKKNLGNKHYILKKIILPTAIILYIIMVLEWTYVGFGDTNYRPIALLTDFIIFMTFIIFVIVIVCKTPKTHDIFNIREEGIRLMICILVQFFGTGMVTIIGTLGFVHVYYVVILLQHIFALTTFTAILIQTFLVFLTIGIANKSQQSISLQFNHTTHQSTVSVTAPSVDIEAELHHYVTSLSRCNAVFSDKRCNTKSKEHGHGGINLNYVLEHEDYFEFFILHLMKEWSTEVVISLIEFQQFEEYILNTNEFKEQIRCMDDATIKGLDMLKLNKSIPKSYIVYNENGDDETINVRLFEEMIDDKKQKEYNDKFNKKMFHIKNVAHKLYKKYVETGSEFEINISYYSRIEFEKLMSDYYEWLLDQQSVLDLLTLFHEIKREMIKLLGYSFGRFKNSDEFVLIKHKK